MALTPGTGKLGQVDMELGLAEPAAVGQATRRIRHALKLGLRNDVLLDGLLQAGVVLVGGKVLDERLED